MGRPARSPRVAGVHLSGKGRPPRGTNLFIHSADHRRSPRTVRRQRPGRTATPARRRRPIRSRRATRSGALRRSTRNRRNARAPQSTETKMILIALASLVVATVLAILLRAFWIRSGLNARQTIATLAAALFIVVVVGLAATGRLNWIAAAIAAVVPFAQRIGQFGRLFPWLASLF